MIFLHKNIFSKHNFLSENHNDNKLLDVSGSCRMNSQKHHQCGGENFLLKFIVIYEKQRNYIYFRKLVRFCCLMIEFICFWVSS
jgi:hypothetical protein